jgi:hypothetical protein
LLFWLTDKAMNVAVGSMAQGDCGGMRTIAVFQFEVKRAVGYNVLCHFHHLGGVLAEEGTSSIAQRLDFLLEVGNRFSNNSEPRCCLLATLTVAEWTKPHNNVVKSG